MKKIRSKYYITNIILLHILVYFFKIDRDVFAVQEYVSRPNQTCTEQPLSKNAFYFGRTLSDVAQFYQSFVTVDEKIRTISSWQAILLSYNSNVRNRLKLQESITVQAMKFISILHKQNICQNSSEDDPTAYYVFA